MYTKLLCVLFIFLVNSAPAMVAVNAKINDNSSIKENYPVENDNSSILLFNDSMDLYILKLMLAHQANVESIEPVENYVVQGNKLNFNNRLISDNKVTSKLSLENAPDIDLSDFEPTEQTTHNPIYNLGISLVRGFLAGTGEAYRIKEQYTTDKTQWKHYGTLWHDYAMLRDAATIGVGVAVAEYSKLKFWKFVQGLFTAAAVNFITFQMSYNVTLGESPFRQSKFTTSRMESLGSFPVMGLILMSAIALEIVL